MIVKSSRLVLQIFAALAVGTALLAGAVAFAFTRGPVSLGFMTPFIEDALNAQLGASEVRVEDTVLAWSAEDRNLDVRALELSVLGSDDQLLAEIPEVDIRFSGLALLRGLLAPTRLEISGARLRLVRDPEGGVKTGFETLEAEGRDEDTQRLVANLIQELLQPPDRSRITGYLSGLSIVDARLDVIDRRTGTTWSADQGEISLERDDEGIRAELVLDVAAGDLSGRFEGSGLYNGASGLTQLGVSFDSVEPSLLAHIEPSLDPLRRFELPLSGSIIVTLDKDLAIPSLTFDLTGATGVVRLPELYSEPLSVASVGLSGRVDDDFSRLVLENGSIDAGGPRARFSGDAVRQDGSVEISLEGEAWDVPVDDLDRLWPPILGPVPRRWVTQNLGDGVVHNARVELSLKAPSDDPAALEVVEVGGEITASGVTVHYLRPMPPVLEATGRATFDRSRFLIEVDSGRNGELLVETATIDLVQLDEPGNAAAEIELTAAGPVKDALKVLDSEPLRFASTLGLDPALVGGAQRTNLSLRVPLRRGTTFDDVGAAAAASLAGFTQEDGPFGHPVSDGDLTLEIDKTGLKVEGSATVGGFSVEAKWVERFAPDAPFRTRYEFSGIVEDEGLAVLGLDTARFASGAIGIGTVFTIFDDGSMVGLAELDLVDTEITVRDIGLHKPAGTAARGTLEFHVQSDGKITDITNFQVMADGLAASGRASFRAENGTRVPEHVEFDRLAFGGSDISGTIAMDPDGMPEIVIGGPRLDLRPILRDRLGLREGDATGPSDVAEGTGPAFRITVDESRPLAVVRLGDESQLLGVVGVVEHDGERFRKVDVRGGLGPKGELVVRLEEEDTTRELTVAAADAGAFLRMVGWSNSIEDGRLVIEGTINDDEEGQPVLGQAIIENFRLLDGPVLARVLTLASFRGIADTLSGEGISFDRLELPFRLTKETLEITDGKMRGSELGILAEGVINRKERTIDIEGEVAPAYTLNSILGKIPVIGPMLTGGGDGVFAAAYSVDGPLDEPKVTVNPLTVLTPGFTRRIFTGFGDPEESDPDDDIPPFPLGDPNE
ncbi:MAG: AsmA-like C-terminal domain-containing protein [Alphaproteobacteria bacterium]